MRAARGVRRAEILKRGWKRRVTCGYVESEARESPAHHARLVPTRVDNREGQGMGVTSAAEKWVDEVTRLTEPDRVVWCDGSQAEYDRLVDQMLGDGTLVPMNQRTYPGCYRHPSHP